MTKPLANPIAFTGQTPPWSLTQLDANFANIQSAINDTLTYSNYFVDQSGVANSVILSIPTTLAVGLIAGTLLEVKIANANTAAVTITINALTAQKVINPDGSVMISGQLLVGQIVLLCYDGTNFQFLGSTRSVGDVLRYGADPTGVLDSGTAIANAITALGATGGTVLFAPGTYKHAASITLTPNVILYGYGVTLNYTGAGTQITSAATGVLNQAGMIGIALQGLSATVQMQLNSIYQCVFRDIHLLTNSRTNTCIAIAVNTAGTQNLAGNYNSAFSLFENILQDTPVGGVGCGTFITMTGTDASHVTTLNTFVNCSAERVNVIGLDFTQWCDSNTFSGHCEIYLAGDVSPANGIGAAMGRTGPGVYAENIQMFTVDTFANPAVDNRQGIVANYGGANVVKFVCVGLFEFGPSVPNNALVSTNLQSAVINQAPRGVTNFLSYHLLGANVGVGVQAAANVLVYAQNVGQGSGGSQYAYYAQGSGLFNAGTPTLGAAFGCQPGAAASSGPYTVTYGIGFYAVSGANGANATVTNAYGFRCDDQTFGTNNTGYFSGMTAGANKWAFYGSGNAASLLTGPLTVSSIAVPAGGTAGQGLMVSTASNLGMFFGSGAPTLSAAQGSIYLRTDGSSTSTRLYVNTNGATTWTNFTSAA